MNILNKKLASPIIILTFLFLPIVVAAQQINLWNIFNNIITMVLAPIFVGLVTIMFVWAGFLYLTAQGDPSKVQKANQAVIWAVVGVAVGLLAHLVRPFVNTVLGL
jgi:heme/copper-type cytochrome/quinol oxidase subunit 2